MGDNNSIIFYIIIKDILSENLQPEKRAGRERGTSQQEAAYESRQRGFAVTERKVQVKMHLSKLNRFHNKKS
jgi:hypothetical protein